MTRFKCLTDSDICILSISAFLSIYRSVCLLAFSFCSFLSEGSFGSILSWSQMKERKEDCTHCGWATKGHQVLRWSELPVLGPGEVDPGEGPWGSVRGHLFESLLIPRLGSGTEAVTLQIPEHRGA